MRRGLDPRTPKRGQPEPMTAKRTLGGDMRIHRPNVRAGSGAGWVSQRANVPCSGHVVSCAYKRMFVSMAAASRSPRSPPRHAARTWRCWPLGGPQRRMLRAAASLQGQGGPEQRRAACASDSPQEARGRPSRRRAAALVGDSYPGDKMEGAAVVQPAASGLAGSAVLARPSQSRPIVRRATVLTEQSVGGY